MEFTELKAGDMTSQATAGLVVTYYNAVIVP